MGRPNSPGPTEVLAPQGAPPPWSPSMLTNFDLPANLQFEPLLPPKEEPQQNGAGSPPPNEFEERTANSWGGAFSGDLFPSSPNMNGQEGMSQLDPGKVMMDDALMSELMELDPLPDHLTDGWLAGPDASFSLFGLPGSSQAPSSGFSPVFRGGGTSLCIGGEGTLESLSGMMGGNGDSTFQGVPASSGKQGGEEESLALEPVSKRGRNGLLFSDESGEPDGSKELAIGEVNSTKEQVADEFPNRFRERLLHALKYVGQGRKDILAQIWVPQKEGSRQLLTTREQPFHVEEGLEKLKVYRTVSASFLFDAEMGTGFQGLPGRVFKSGRPEWSPNVQYYTSSEYLRVDHATR
jgi:hypothetical protein